MRIRSLSTSIEPRACSLGRCSAQCENGCGDCDGSCRGTCDGGCSGDCEGGCSGSCDSTCRGNCDGCSGCGSGCANSCSGCSNTCRGGCTSCSGNCSGSCTNTCQGSCQETCNTKCNTACTSVEAAQAIANLGANIAMGHIIKAVDYVQLKQAMDNEYSRRNKPVPSGFVTTPQSGKPVIHEIIQKVLVDVYNYDGQAAHDWRNTFQVNDIANADKLQPAIVYIKTLMSQIV